MDTETIPFLLRNPVSAVTHLLWCLLGIYTTAIFWKMTRFDGTRQLAVCVFGVSMVLLYAASGTYHAVFLPEPYLNYLRLVDHSAIYFLIAGTYTPVCTVLLRGKLRSRLLCLVWGLALLGIACKWLVAAPPYPITVGLYIGLGWIGVIPGRQLIAAVGWRAMAWGLFGGILYTCGGIADAIKWPTLWPGVVGPHEVLHLFDMAGTCVHIHFIARYVIFYQSQS